MATIISKLWKNKIVLFFAILSLPMISLSGSDPIEVTETKKEVPFHNCDSVWVDSVMGELTLEERVAQLIMVAVYSNKIETYNQKMVRLVKEYQLGGIIFMQGGPARQALLNNRLQQASNIPLMIGIDGEWGLGMRLDSTISFPKAMTLGAIRNDNIIYEMGEEIGRQCNRMGIHVNFAPVIDINSNPNNPVINNRSFGETKEKVARKGIAYAAGMQSVNVLAVGKHFPGHGDTDSDSHYSLPVIKHDKARLDSLELYPFSELIKDGVGAMMVAHIAIPKIIEDPKRPASLAPEVIKEMLVDSMGFEGLIFTDALNMKGVTKNYEPGQIEVEALKAGNDILLFPLDIPLAIKKIVEAVKNGEISEEEINSKCRKVLMAKDWMEIKENRFVDLENLHKDLHTPNAYRIRDELIRKSTTVINGEGRVPIKDLQYKKVAYVSVGWEDDHREILKYLNYYTKVDGFKIVSERDKKVIKKLSNYDYLIVGISQKSNSAYRKYGIKAWEYETVSELMESDSSLLAFYGNPYALKNIKETLAGKPVIIGYEANKANKINIAQVIFGGEGYSGVLPVSVNDTLKLGQGSKLKHGTRLSYVKPYYFNLGDKAFRVIDSIVYRSIKDSVIPGCQILYAKDGRVVYNKTFGYHTYNKNRRVTEFDLYDLASVTKVAASTVSLMKLYEQDKINPFQKVSKYNETLEKTDKKNIKIYELLCHNAGLKPWIPFYINTIDTAGQLIDGLFSEKQSDSFNIEVVENMYLRSTYVDTIREAIIDKPLNRRKRYLYSDLGYYWMPDVIKNTSGMTIDKYANNEFYSKLGMNYTTYRPLDRFKYREIVPSEVDEIFRKSVVHGFVNDQGAAMLGGISGHAGLFSNANDIAKLSQMLLNNGSYGGEEYLSLKTIETFNKAYFKNRRNRRAMGFDKPALRKGDRGPTCLSASQESFGHSGFTGTYFWVDPANNSVYVFLSNRTFPDASNKKLIRKSVRTNIHQAFYDVFENESR